MESKICAVAKHLVLSQRPGAEIGGKKKLFKTFSMIFYKNATDGKQFLKVDQTSFPFVHTPVPWAVAAPAMAAPVLSV